MKIFEEVLEENSPLPPLYLCDKIWGDLNMTLINTNLVKEVLSHVKENQIVINQYFRDIEALLRPLHNRLHFFNRFHLFGSLLIGQIGEQIGRHNCGHIVNRHLIQVFVSCDVVK